MHFKVSIVMLIVAIICHSSMARLMNCNDGEKYWCQSMAIAQKCQAQKYCKEFLKKRSDGVTKVSLKDPPYHLRQYKQRIRARPDDTSSN